LIQCPQWKSFFIQRILVYHNHLKSKDKKKFDPILGTLDPTRKVKAQSVDYFKSITLPTAALAQPAVHALPAAAPPPPPPRPEQPPPADAQPPPAAAQIPAQPEDHPQQNGRPRRRPKVHINFSGSGGARTTALLPEEEDHDDEPAKSSQNICEGKRPQ
jgi:hypothetical protein